MSTIVAAAWRRYLRNLEERPLRTKATTSACLAALSDVIAQRLAGGAGAQLNWRRTLAMAVFGAVWSGPASHYWQAFLQRLFRGQKVVLEKVALDTLLFGPLCNILMMSYISLVVEGRSARFTREKLGRDYWGVQLNGWKLWPLVSLLNYNWVPLKLRPLVVNIAALFWSSFLILRSRAGGAAAAQLLQRAAFKAA